MARDGLAISAEAPAKESATLRQRFSPKSPLIADDAVKGDIIFSISALLRYARISAAGIDGDARRDFDTAAAAPADTSTGR